MARIAFLCDSVAGTRWGQFNWELIQALLDQHHELHVLTGMDQDLSSVPSRPRLTIIKPFRRWSSWELVPVAKALVQLRPEVLFLTQPAPGSSARHWFGALNAIGLAMEPLHHPVMVSSICDSTNWQRGLGLAVQLSDFVVVNTTAAKYALEAQLGTRFKNRVHLLPITHLGIHPTHNVDLATPSIPFSRWIFVPGTMDEHTDLLATCEILAALLQPQSDWGVVFGGGWGKTRISQRRRFMAELRQRRIDHRVHWTGTPNFAAESHLFHAAHFVLLSPLRASSLSTGHFLRQIIALRKPTLISHLQKCTHALPETANLWLWTAPAAAASNHSACFQEYLEVEADLKETKTPMTQPPTDNLGNLLNRLLVERLRH